MYQHKIHSKQITQGFLLLVEPQVQDTIIAGKCKHLQN